MSSNNKRKKGKQPADSTTAGQPMYHPMYMPNYGAMQPPYAMPAPNGGAFFMPSQPYMTSQPSPAGSGSQSRGSSSRKKPWARNDSDDDVDDDEEEESNFKPKKKVSLTLKDRRSSDGAAAHLALKRVNELPPKFMGRPTVSPSNDKDCVACGVYMAEVMLLPCGHASFCTKCVNKLHDKSHSLKRLQICPAESCLASISSWVRLRNVMS